MISVIHMEHARISAISNLWHARYPAQWRRMLAVANLLDVPLLALIYQRLRELQDAAARDAFTRQEDFGVVTWEWRQHLAAARSGNERLQKVPIVPGVVSPGGTRTSDRIGADGAKVVPS